MNTLHARLMVLGLLLCCGTTFSQSTDSFRLGLAIEIGGGQNNLFWTSPTSGECPCAAAVDRTHFSLTPTIRLNYQVLLAGDFALLPFVGYNQLGGSSGWSTRYSFQTIEFGTFVLYRIPTFYFGVGTKINRHMSVRFVHGGVAPEDRSSWFTKWSEDAGLRATYEFMPMSLSLESWFGLGNLAEGELSAATIRENHYRILFGYTL